MNKIILSLKQLYIYQLFPYFYEMVIYKFYQEKFKLNFIIQIKTPMNEDRSYVGDRTPAQCRNGPIPDRSCTDFYCCIMYLILIAAVIFLVLFSGGVNMTPEEIKSELESNNFGTPFLAIIQAAIPIILAIAFVAAICLILVITTFTIPAIATYIYIPLFLAIMLFLGIIFLIRYFGPKIPFVSDSIQDNFAKSKSVVTLITGLAFIFGFLIAIFTIFTKRSKFSNIMPVLRIARAAFWPNCYMFIFSFIFTFISIGALVANISLLGICLTRKNNVISPIITASLVAVQALWTHGFLEALSDFFYESIAIHWYYKKRREIQKQETCCDSLCLTFKMIFKHIGTIVFGHVLAYIPETVNTMLGRCQKRNICCYNIFCLWHRFTFRHLTKYCYFETILQSLSFCPANREMFGLRQRTKGILPQIYMMGNFYITLAKIFCVMAGLIICYFLIANSNVAHIFSNPINLIGPMVVVFFASLQISNHFMNSTGLVGDTIVFAYSADLQIQKKNYGQLQPYSSPDSIRDIINEVKAGHTYIYDS